MLLSRPMYDFMANIRMAQYVLIHCIGVRAFSHRSAPNQPIAWKKARRGLDRSLRTGDLDDSHWVLLTVHAPKCLKPL
jgi:hypothetical protein